MKSFYTEFKGKKISELNNALIDACLYEDLDKVKYLLTSPELTKHAKAQCHNGDYNDVLFPLRQACFKGNIEIVKYLLASPDLKEYADIHFDDDQALQIACSQGHLEIVKYLLASPDLKEHADITATQCSAISGACMRGYLDVVKYLLETECFKGKIDLVPNIKTTLTMVSLAGNLESLEYLLDRPELSNQENSNFALSEACTYGHIDLIKFLLHSDKLKFNAQIEHDNYISFKKALEQEEHEILHYFIFSLNVPKTKEIKDYLDKCEDRTFANKIENYFSLLELKNNLNIELNPDTINSNRKIKI